MTIMSANSIFSDKQAITATAASSNIMDLGSQGTPYGAAQALARDPGRGEPIPFLVQSVQDFAAAGSATLTIALQMDDNAGFASPTTVFTTPAIAKADLVAGYQISIQVLPKQITERYIRFYYTVATGPFTAGKLTAAITMGNQDAR